MNEPVTEGMWVEIIGDNYDSTDYRKTIGLIGVIKYEHDLKKLKIYSPENKYYHGYWIDLGFYNYRVLTSPLYSLVGDCF